MEESDSSSSSGDDRELNSSDEQMDEEEEEEGMVPSISQGQIGDVEESERVDTLLQCLLYTCPEQVVPVILKMVKGWRAPDYDEGEFNISVTRVELVTFRRKITQYSMKPGIFKECKSLVEAGYLTHHSTISVRPELYFSSKVKAFIFKVISLDAALEIAKKIYNSAILERSLDYSVLVASKRRDRSKAPFSIGILGGSVLGRDAIKRKIAETIKDPSIHIYPLSEAKDDCVLEGGYYDATLLCGDDLNSAKVHLERKEHVEALRLEKKETFFTSEEKLCAFVDKRLSRHKRRKKK